MTFDLFFWNERNFPGMSAKEIYQRVQNPSQNAKADPELKQIAKKIATKIKRMDGVVGDFCNEHFYLNLGTNGLMEGLELVDLAVSNGLTCFNPQTGNITSGSTDPDGMLTEIRRRKALGRKLPKDCSWLMKRFDVQLNPFGFTRRLSGTFDLNDDCSIRLSPIGADEIQLWHPSIFVRNVSLDAFLCDVFSAGYSDCRSRVISTKFAAILPSNFDGIWKFSFSDSSTETEKKVKDFVGLIETYALPFVNRARNFTFTDRDLEALFPQYNNEWLLPAALRLAKREEIAKKIASKYFERLAVDPAKLSFYKKYIHEHLKLDV